MKDAVVVFAVVEASERDAQAVFAAVQQLARQSRLEAGCLRYDVYRSGKAPVLSIIQEEWESNDALQAHRGSPHVEGFKIEISKTTAMVWVSQCELTSEA
jgi:quinol monooxygenase YgiN